MFQPTESDIVAAMLTWARRHGRDSADILSLAPAEWASVWRLAQWHAFKRRARDQVDRFFGMYPQAH